MAVVYVAHSIELGKWASDVGLGKNIYMIGVVDEDPAVQAALDEKPCGAGDWLVLARQEGETFDAPALIARLAAKEKTVDPNFYPRLRGRTGVFRIKVENVENHILVKTALDGFETKNIKIKPADIAAYILHNALK